MRLFFLLIIFIGITSCGDTERTQPEIVTTSENDITDARGFSFGTSAEGYRTIAVNSPWPGAERSFNYLLIPDGKTASSDQLDQYDAVVPIPIKTIVVTSTTHVAALEAMGVEWSLGGFPGREYISSRKTRKRIEAGQVVELGMNELINVEVLLDLDPDLVVGFSIDNQNQAYETIEDAGIPVVYNGDWTEATPLGKAEWIKFFGAFFNQEEEAAAIYGQIKEEYLNAKAMAAASRESPSVLSGAVYKDVWYLPAGDSWAAAFIKDANARYLWTDSSGNGSLSLSFESVLDRGLEADFWISPSQYTSYESMRDDNPQYAKFKPFEKRKIYTFASTIGETGGLLYYELGPQRPDLILKDLISIFHPDLLTDHEPFFFKPLE